jgi:O6-methylguanine-DNA--protein-cysteine methyltransferase
MKAKSTTQLPEKSKGKGIKLQIKSLTQKSNDQERFEEEILKISLKRPKNAFNYFILEIRKKNNITESLTKSTAEFAKIYQRLPNSELKKYEELAEKDKQRYKEHMDLVKKYLIEKPQKEKATTYAIFIDEKLHEARESASAEDPKEIRKAAKLQWEAMIPVQRKFYEEKKEQHLKFYQELKVSNKRVSAYSLFVQDEAKAAGNRGEKSNFKDTSEKWRKLSDAAKELYAVYAQETINDREQNRKLYMLAYGIKPKLPKSAYKIFLKEKVKEGKLGVKVLEVARALWDKLSDEQKEVYMKKAQKEKLTYELIKREYVQNNRKSNGPSAWNLFIRDLKGTEKSEFSEIGFFNYAYKKWKSLDKVLICKYAKASKEMREKQNEEYEEKMKAEKNQAPKRALSAYNIYLREKMPEFKKKFPKKEQTEIFQIISQEFAKIPPKERKIYEEKAKKSKEETEILKKEWEMEQSKKEETDNSKKAKKKKFPKKAAEESSDEDEENEEPGKRRKNNANKSRSRTAAKNSKALSKPKVSVSEEKLKNEEDEKTAVDTNNEKKSKKNDSKVKKEKHSDDKDMELDESLKSGVNKQKKGKVTKQTALELRSEPKAGRAGVKAGK